MSITVGSNDIKQNWRNYGSELVLARNYHLSYLLTGHSTHRNPVLESILPSLLHIKLLALLDEALVEFVQSHNLTMPKKYHATLRGRVMFLESQGLLADPKSINEAVTRRNDLAHISSTSVDWKQLDADIKAIEFELLNMNIISTANDKFEYFGERSAVKSSQEPDVIAVTDYVVGVKEGEKIVAEIKWSQKLMRD